MLKKMPTKYIYEPWDAPVDVQRSVGCVVGKDYPHRIVVHEKVSKVNIQRMSAAFKSSKSTSAGTQASFNVTVT